MQRLPEGVDPAAAEQAWRSYLAHAAGSRERPRFTETALEVQEIRDVEAEEVERLEV